jgi:hypothetical protein
MIWAIITAIIALGLAGCSCWWDIRRLGDGLALRKSLMRQRDAVAASFLVIVGIAGCGNGNTNHAASSGSQTAAASHTAHLPAATKDPRWLGLADCLSQHHLSNGATDATLSTYGITTSVGAVVGNVTYSRQEQFKYGPVSYAFVTDPPPPSTAQQSVIDCVTETFGPHADSSSYVRKYLPSKRVTALTTGPTDPRWTAMKGCFAANGLTINNGASQPAMLVVGRVGIVSYGIGGFPIHLGPVSYGLDYSTTSPSARAFTGCVTTAFRAH